MHLHLGSCLSTFTNKTSDTLQAGLRRQSHASSNLASGNLSGNPLHPLPCQTREPALPTLSSPHSPSHRIRARIPALICPLQHIVDRVRKAFLVPNAVLRVGFEPSIIKHLVNFCDQGGFVRDEGACVEIERMEGLGTRDFFSRLCFLVVAGLFGEEFGSFGGRGSVNGEVLHGGDDGGVCEAVALVFRGVGEASTGREVNV
jgi:hypothetical protein